MKKILFTLFLFASCSKIPVKEPNDWYFLQKSFPANEINYEAFKQAILETQRMKNSNKIQSLPSWVSVGPINIGGRVTDIEVVSDSISNTYFIGSASGGIFKSTDNGNSWNAIFDSELSLSIGDIAIDPTNPQTIYVGQGEANAGGGSVCYGGFGVSKSTDGGNTWQNIGLQNSNAIGKIVVDPQNSNNVFVAAMGRLFSTNSERGIYRSQNAGQTWTQVLAVNDSTGGIDLAINPQNPNIVYAATWERKRSLTGRFYAGIGSGIYRSTDGGTTWNLMTNGLPQPSTNNGKIAISISNSNPNVLYATYCDHPGFFLGVYKTTDGGNSWTQLSGNGLTGCFSSFGWWFNRLFVDPTNSDKVFLSGLNLYSSTDGGNNWNVSGSSMHVDHHALFIFPNNQNKILCGNDGGLYTSNDGGNFWTKINGLPNIQFYNVEIDFLNPQKYYGGSQDNGTLKSLSTPNYFSAIFGGDGFYVLVDPTNSNNVFAEYQYGALSRSTDGGNSFQIATTGINNNDRKNWQTPVILDKNYPNTLYYGSNKLYKSNNSAQSWTQISPDLTKGAGTGNTVFGTITTIAVSPVDTNIVYVGCDDGNVQVSKDGGGLWTNVSTSLPLRWITRIVADPKADSVAYVSLSGFRIDEPLPHIFRTENFGQTWVSISSNLPDAPVNTIVVDPKDTNVLYIGTDTGTFYTTNLGVTWDFLGNSLPNVPVNELKFHEPTRKLLAGTYGRSMFTLDLSNVFPEDFNFIAPTQTDIVFDNIPFTVNWETSANGTGSLVTYTVKIDTSTNFENPLFTATTTDTFLVIPALTFLLTGNYCYEISAENEEGFKTLAVSQTTQENFECFVIQIGPKIGESETQKQTFKLSQNYPNPFNPETKITYELPAKTKAKLTIFNVLGEKVQEFLIEKPSGSVVWNGKNFSGKQVSSGIYFYKLETRNGFSQTKKMILMK
ncbi:T9SS type A sorting domain-containing protein [bacterium]|nr:T9SS type A sorting domain-containing protein [bacterium]